MRISTVINRLLGDIAHDPYVFTFVLFTALLACWLMAEGTVDITRRTRAAMRRRAARLTRTRPRPRRRRRPPHLARTQHPATPRQHGPAHPLPRTTTAPRTPNLRDTRTARRRLHAEIEAALKTHATADG